VPKSGSVGREVAVDQYKTVACPGSGPQGLVHILFVIFLTAAPNSNPSFLSQTTYIRRHCSQKLEGLAFLSPIQHHPSQVHVPAELPDLARQAIQPVTDFVMQFLQRQHDFNTTMVGWFWDAPIVSECLLLSEPELAAR
jgi:hypothetical protein